MIIITGALGFIGSCLISYFNQKGIENIIAVDDFSKTYKFNNLRNKKIKQVVERADLANWLPLNAKAVTAIIHIGARTDTAEFNKQLLTELNLNYTKMLWRFCVKHPIPFLYASSAATYGLGEYGFNDKHSIVHQLVPLNPYGYSKNEFDKWALSQKTQPVYWAGLKFFNVYGPNEYHKSRMASVIFHFFKQIQQNESVNLFRSHHPDYTNGAQKRDFIFVKDVLKVIEFLFDNAKTIESGLYNVGTGTARTFNDLAKALFIELDLAQKIQYIDTPLDIRDKYQYFTEANITKLVNAGYTTPFTKLEDGISEYVNNYLKTGKYF